MENVGIIIELEQGRVKPINHGVITLARKQSAESADITAFVIEADADRVREDLAAFGVNRLVRISFPEGPDEARGPHQTAKVLARAVTEQGITSVFGLSTANGRNLLPRMAAILDAPLVMDCTDVDLEKKIARTSQYSGKTMATIQLFGNIRMYGIRPRAVEAEPVDGNTEMERLEFLAGPGECGFEKFRVLPLDEPSEPVQEDMGPGLGESDVIIAGGRGMKDGENFSVLFDFAKKMNAAVGASRVAVDSGWVPYAMQVGQTGEKVSPKVYIACGISGSVQHFAGMKTAGLIIAVNTDENAAIMANADYTVHEDLFEIIPRVTRLLDQG